MTEYIERNEAINRLQEIANDYEDGGMMDAFYVADYCLKHIMDLPTAADVVEVVRCGQCKYGKYTGTEWFCDKHSGHADKFVEDASYHEYHRKYWFCADGEKRADNG